MSGMFFSGHGVEYCNYRSTAVSIILTVFQEQN